MAGESNHQKHLARFVLARSQDQGPDHTGQDERAAATARDTTMPVMGNMPPRGPSNRSNRHHPSRMGRAPRYPTHRSRRYAPIRAPRGPSARSPRAPRGQGLSRRRPAPSSGFLCIAPNYTIPIGPNIILPPHLFGPGYSQPASTVPSMTPSATTHSAPAQQAPQAPAEKESPSSERSGSGPSRVLAPTAEPFRPSSSRLVNTNKSTHSAASENKEPEITEESEKTPARISRPLSANVPSFQPAPPSSTSTSITPAMSTSKQSAPDVETAYMMARSLQKGRPHEARRATTEGVHPNYAELIANMSRAAQPSMPRTDQPVNIPPGFALPSQQTSFVSAAGLEHIPQPYESVQARAGERGVPSSVPTEQAFPAGQQRVYPTMPSYPPGFAARSYAEYTNTPSPASTSVRTSSHATYITTPSRPPSSAATHSHAAYTETSSRATPMTASSHQASIKTPSHAAPHVAASSYAPSINTPNRAPSNMAASSHPPYLNTPSHAIPNVAASPYATSTSAPRRAFSTFLDHPHARMMTPNEVDAYIRATQERDMARTTAHENRVAALRQEQAMNEVARRAQVRTKADQLEEENRQAANHALEQRRLERLRRERFNERERILRGETDPQDVARESNFQGWVEFMNYPNYSRNVAPDPLFPRAHVVAENPENQRLVSMFETAFNNMSLYAAGYINFQGRSSSGTEQAFTQQATTGRASTGTQFSRPGTSWISGEIPNWDDPAIRNDPRIRRDILNNSSFIPYMGPTGQGRARRVLREDFNLPPIGSETLSPPASGNITPSATGSEPENTQAQPSCEAQKAPLQPMTFAAVLSGASGASGTEPAPQSSSNTSTPRPAFRVVNPAQMASTELSSTRMRTPNQLDSQRPVGAPAPRRRHRHRH